LGSILVDDTVEDRHVGGRSEPSLHMASVLVYGRAGDDRHVESAIDYVGRCPPSIEGKNRTPLLVGIFGWRKSSPLSRE
jgi:hypothetical protein